MSNIIAFAGANLPSVASLSSSLRVLETDVGPSGSAILKMDKTGHWVFGADQTEVQDGSHWAINPFSFVHGYIAWGDGEVLGEVMVGVAQPLPETPQAPPGAAKGWEMQVGCSLKCLNGEDARQEVRFTTTSVGGKKSVQSLAAAIASQVDADQTKPVAVVELLNDHYQHKSYGKIFTPVFKIAKWMGLSEEAAPEATATPPAAVEAPKPARRRRAPVAAA